MRDYSVIVTWRRESGEARPRQRTYSSVAEAVMLQVVAAYADDPAVFNVAVYKGGAQITDTFSERNAVRNHAAKHGDDIGGLKRL